MSVNYFGALIFNENIILKCYNLNYNTKQEIFKRVRIENNLNDKSIKQEEDKDIKDEEEYINLTNNDF